MWQDPEQPMQAKWETIANTATHCTPVLTSIITSLNSSVANKLSNSLSVTRLVLIHCQGWWANILPVCTASILTWWSTMFVLFRPMLKYELIPPPPTFKREFYELQFSSSSVILYKILYLWRRKFLRSEGTFGITKTDQLSASLFIFCWICFQFCRMW